MRQLTLQQKLDMANKTAHGLMQEVDEQKKKQKALADENDQLKSKVKELSEEKLTNDAVIIVKERELKTYEDAISEYRLDGRKMLARIKSLEITILEKDNKIRKLTNDLEEEKQNNHLDWWRKNIREGALDAVERSFQNKIVPDYLDLSKSTPQTPSQQIMGILKQLEPERMVFEFSQVSKEVNRIIAYNKAKAMATSDMLSKPE
jgi:uncharacterized protein YqeY